jgi:hypothetical protein
VSAVARLLQIDDRGHVLVQYCRSGNWDKGKEYNSIQSRQKSGISEDIGLQRGDVDAYLYQKRQFGAKKAIGNSSLLPTVLNESQSSVVLVIHEPELTR